MRQSDGTRRIHAVDFTTTVALVGFTVAYTKQRGSVTPALTVFIDGAPVSRTVATGSDANFCPAFIPARHAVRVEIFDDAKSEQIAFDRVTPIAAVRRRTEPCDRTREIEIYLDERGDSFHPSGVDITVDAGADRCTERTGILLSVQSFDADEYPIEIPLFLNGTFLETIVLPAPYAVAQVPLALPNDRTCRVSTTCAARLRWGPAHPLLPGCSNLHQA